MDPIRQKSRIISEMEETIASLIKIGALNPEKVLALSSLNEHGQAQQSIELIPHQE